MRIWEHRHTLSAVILAVAAFGGLAAVVITMTRHSGVFGGHDTYYVSPTGSDAQTGTDAARPLRTIQKALQRAQPGDRIALADGSYRQSITSVRSGRKDAPITIQGSLRAVLYGDSSRIAEIHHSYLTLDGFTIDGHFGLGDTKQDYRDKLIYAIGQRSGKGVEHVVITNMHLQNAGGECLRLRYFAKYNEVAHSTIQNCGIYDFRFHDGGKNGEGIYIGTAPEQRKDGKNPTADPDRSVNNYVHDNTITTNGNECVDIKEAARNNLVERNTCSGQADPDSGGFDARGNHNVFRNNTVRDTVGAAVRLGGDTATDGLYNDIYNNIFINNQAGVLMIRRLPQGKICNNSVTPAAADNTGSEADNTLVTTADCQ